MDIKNRVNEIIFSVLKKHQITMDMIVPEKRIVDELKADSLDIIEMLLAFEDEFDILIDDEDTKNIRTIAIDRGLIAWHDSVIDEKTLPEFIRRRLLKVIRNARDAYMKKKDNI